MDIDREKLAWAAGLFEGEGCFCVSFSGGQRSMTAAVGMTDEDVVRQFGSIIGFGEINTREPEKAHYKRQWVWKVNSFEEVQATMALLWPWLKTRRRAKIKTILTKYHKAAPESIEISRIRTQAIKKALLKNNGGRTQRDIAKEFNVSPATISQLKYNRQRSPLYKPRLSKDSHLEIRRLYQLGKSQKELAELFECSRPNISLIVNNKRGKY